MSAVKEEVFAYIKNDLRIPLNVKALGLGPCLENGNSKEEKKAELGNNWQQWWRCTVVWNKQE